MARKDALLASCWFRDGEPQAAARLTASRRWRLHAATGGIESVAALRLMGHLFTGGTFVSRAAGTHSGNRSQCHIVNFF